MRRDCLICGTPEAHEHHSLPKSVWPRFRDHPDVFVPLCFRCHQDWHDGRARVCREDLPSATWALIETNASERWCDHWYPSRPHADLPF